LKWILVENRETRSSNWFGRAEKKEEKMRKEDLKKYWFIKNTLDS